MKDYLNKQETNSFLLVGFINDELQKMKDDWNKRGFLTKEELTAIKYAQTYIKKFYMSVIERLNPKESEKLYKRLGKYDFRFIDDYQMQRIMRETTDRLKNAVVPREQFESWCSEIMEIQCKDCNKHWTECELHTVFEDNFVPESSWGLENCRYAYKKL